MSGSWLEILFRYARTRLPLRLLAPWAAVLAAAALAGGRPLSAGSFLLSWTTAAVLISQFRLLDDLADIPRDRLSDPGRVMIQAGVTTPFILFLSAAFMINVILLNLQPVPAAGIRVLVLLTAGACSWYWGLRRIFTSPVLHYHVMLIKYPVIVYLLAGQIRQREMLMMVMVLVYLTFLIYEAVHDDALRREPGSVKAMGLSMAALLVLSLVTALEMAGTSPLGALFQGVVGTGGAVSLAAALMSFKGKRPSTGKTVSILALGTFLVINFVLGVRP